MNNAPETTGEPSVQIPPISPQDDAAVLEAAAEIIAELCDAKERRADDAGCFFPDLRRSIDGTRQIAAYLRYLGGELSAGVPKETPVA